MFDADRPITSSSQDRLGRSVFAKYLARCMQDHHDPESLVIGLYGGFGVGKSSLINLIIEELKLASSALIEEEKPIIMNFSPWSYSGQHQLIYSFFRRLSSTLRNEPNIKNKDKILHLLELYASFFTQKPIPKPLRTKRTVWQKLTFQGKEEVFAWDAGRDLTLVKAELNELLRAQKRKLVIFIDNISRLYPDEIKQMFQIVKSMGDYSNSIYLLAMDKQQVVRSLNKVDSGNNEEFLEKVVQLPFDVPPITSFDLENIFTSRVNSIVATIPEGAWNNEYWADIFYGSLKFFFTNCRDITRYINTLNFGYSRLKDVVNPVDYFALTAIEVFLPEIYAGIRENKDVFTDLLDNVYILDGEELKIEKKRCDDILARNDHVPREILLNLLMNLFPRLRYFYQPGKPFYHSDAAARRLKRICSPDLFNVYFRLSLQSGRIADAEFETIIHSASHPDTFDHTLASLNQDERIPAFLDHLDHQALHTLPRDYAPAIIAALLDNGDLFPVGASGQLSLDTPMRIHRIIHGLLRRYDTPEERFLILQTAIANATKSIFIIAHEITEQSLEHLEESDTFLPLEFRDVTPEQLYSLQKLTASRIKYWAEIGRLAEHPHLLSLLYAWRNWGEKNECKQYVEKMTSSDKGIVTFLTATLDKAIGQAMSSHEKSPLWEKYLQDIDAFIAINVLEEHAKILFENDHFEKLREREQLALMIFLDLIKASTRKDIPRTTV